MKKYTVRIPTEQYGYVEMETDNLVELKSEHDNIKKVFAGEKVEGMSVVEFSKFCQKFLIENAYDNEELDKLSPLQQWWVKVTSNALQRIADKDK